MRVRRRSPRVIPFPQDGSGIHPDNAYPQRTGKPAATGIALARRLGLVKAHQPDERQATTGRTVIGILRPTQVEWHPFGSRSTRPIQLAVIPEDGRPRASYLHRGSDWSPCRIAIGGAQQAGQPISMCS